MNQQEIPRTIPEAFLRQIQRIPHRTAMIYYGRKISYHELGICVRRMAKIFLNLGIRPGDRIAIMMSNVPQFVFSYYGAILAGAIVTPINLLAIPKTYRAANRTVVVPDEIRAQIQDASPSIIVAFDFYYPILRAVQNRQDEMDRTRILLTRPHEYMPAPLKRLAPIKLRHDGRWFDLKDKEKRDGLYLLADLMKGEEKEPLQPFVSLPGLDAAEHDIVQLQYTGGTTGTPKGVMLTHDNLLSNIQQTNEHLGPYLASGKEIVLGILPFFHLYGLTAAMQITLLEQSGTLVLVADPQEIKQWASWIREYKVTVVPSVPRLYELLIIKNRSLLEKKAFESVKLCVNGAGVLPQKTRRMFEECTGARIVEGYGLSEASPIVSICSPGDFREGSIGKPIPRTEVKILDLESGLELSVGQEGEIIVRGPQIMLGYWNREEETAQVLRDGWLHTGDMGYRDEDGFLYITDRIKDMVKILGENAFPSKIEQVLMRHPAIEDIAVVGMTDERGERLVACIVLRDPCADYEGAKRAIAAFASDHLASFEIPRDIRFVDSLDAYKNQLGKILRRQIREAIRNGNL